MFSQTVEYALRAVVHLAGEAPEPRTTEQIAAATQVPQAYLAKVLKNLVNAGVVHSQRGLGGGMTLAKLPAEFTILAVVNAVEPICRIRACPLNLPEHCARLCPLHARLDQAIGLVEEALASTTLADLLADPKRRAPLCDATKRRAAKSSRSARR